MICCTKKRTGFGMGENHELCLHERSGKRIRPGLEYEPSRWRAAGGNACPASHCGVAPGLEHRGQPGSGDAHGFFGTSPGDVRTDRSSIVRGSPASRPDTLGSFTDCGWGNATAAVGRPSRRYLQLILTGVAPIIHAEALLWFPRESELPFCGVGNNLLTEAGCARLIALISREHDWKAEPTYLCNHAAETAWHREFPQIRQLLTIYVADTRPLGWVVAANKGSEKRFRHSDAALLAPFASLVRLYDQSVSQAHEMQQLLLGFARSLTAAVDAKDPRRAGHSERTARIAVEIARQLSLPEIDLGEVYLAGLLHDIGKIGVPEYLFHKTAAWSTQDWQQHQRHTQIGYSFLADLPKLRQIALAVLYHHEHYDGSGYPDGLQSEAIPILARIVAVADAYDAWSTGYWDRSPVSVSEVEKRLLAESGSKWDPQVVQALLAARDALLAIRPGGVGQSFCQHVCQTLTVSEPGESTAKQSDVEAYEI
jgi:HD-GYP domain-containing protein (c-di-GMP phosphodiesterase class II)